MKPPIGAITDKYRNRLHVFEVMAQTIIEQVTDDEQAYREIGKLYHGLHLASRSSSRFPAEQLARLRQAFEISTAGQYDAWFRPYTETISLCQEARKQVVMVGTQAELNRRCAIADEYLERALNLRSTNISILLEIEKDVYALENVEEEVYRYNRWRWEDEFRNTPEWRKFCEWVSSLPETRKLMDNDVPLEKVAWDNLFIIEVDQFVQDSPVCDGLHFAPRTHNN